MFLAKKFGVKSHQKLRDILLSRDNLLSPTKGTGPFSATLSPTIKSILSSTHATRHHPPNTRQHKDRTPEEAALATERRRPPGVTMRGRIRLQSAEPDAEPGGAWTF